MKKTSTLLLVACCCLLLASRCKKDSDPPPPQLPPATQQGLNTIGFKVNGEVWTPYYECKTFNNPCGAISVEYAAQLGSSGPVNIGCGRKISNKLSALTITSIVSIKRLDNYYDSINVIYQSENNDGTSGVFSKTLFSPPGKFEITRIDTVSKIISGTFEFTLRENNGSGNTLKITEGRFDFTYNACICN